MAASNTTAKPLKVHGFDDVIVTDQLCGNDLDVAVAALTQREQVVFACEQQAQIFEQLTEELSAENALKASLDLIDLRDRAGWTATDEKDALIEAKQLALLADATLDRPGTAAREVTSSGTCLIIAKDSSVLPFAETLGEELAVTCVLEKPPANISPSGNYDLALGQIQSVAGGLGAFDVTFTQFATLIATGRGATQFSAPKDTASSTCDIVIDLVSEQSLLAAEATRDGYLRAPDADALKLAQLGAQAKGLVGTFEKPLYVKYEGSICAHSRSQKTGCTRCVDTCGAQAIQSNGDGVYVDPDMCGGCGGCASVCPTGAIVYDDPPFEFMVQRLKTLIETFQSHAQTSPRVLFIDRQFGRHLIAESARFSQGLPADVIPYEVDNVELIGHAELLAALAAGASEALILKSPKTAKTAIENQSALTHRLLGRQGSMLSASRSLRPVILPRLNKPYMGRGCQLLNMKKSHCLAVVARSPNGSQLRFLGTMESHLLQSPSSPVIPTARSRSIPISVRYAWLASHNARPVPSMIVQIALKSTSWRMRVSSVVSAPTPALSKRSH